MPINRPHYRPIEEIQFTNVCRRLQSFASSRTQFAGLGIIKVLGNPQGIYWANSYDSRPIYPIILGNSQTEAQESILMLALADISYMGHKPNQIITRVAPSPFLAPSITDKTVEGVRHQDQIVKFRGRSAIQADNPTPGFLPSTDPAIKIFHYRQDHSLMPNEPLPIEFLNANPDCMAYLTKLSKPTPEPATPQDNIAALLEAFPAIDPPLNNILDIIKGALDGDR